MIPWLPALIGFLLGATFFRGIDKVLPHLHPLMPDEKIEGIKTKWPKCTLLVLALSPARRPCHRTILTASDEGKTPFLFSIYITVH
jgi:zinc transporter ZupT